VGLDPNRAKEVQSIADEIARYLKKRESGADTLEGVMRWWIARQRLTEAEDKVREAVDILCDQGVVQRRILGDGTVLYSPVRDGAKR
jgi:hypothetical protein